MDTRQKLHFFIHNQLFVAFWFCIQKLLCQGDCFFYHLTAFLWGLFQSVLKALQRFLAEFTFPFNCSILISEIRSLYSGSYHVAVDITKVFIFVIEHTLVVLSADTGFDIFEIKAAATLFAIQNV